MDIYQIWTTYNKQWSRYEILAFTGVLILVCTAMAVCVHRKKLNIIQAAAVLALVVFLGIVFGSTVFTRTGTIRQYELVPFWSWRDIIRYHDWTLLKENLLNCILLLPAGVLLPIIANHKIKWYQALIVGILVYIVVMTDGDEAILEKDRTGKDGKLKICKDKYMKVDCKNLLLEKKT